MRPIVALTAVLVIWIISSAPTAEGDGTEGAYTSYDEMVVQLEELNSTYPEIVGLYNLSERYGIPLTHQGRTIWAVKLSDNPHLEEENETDVLICGLHHGREWATVEVVLNFLEYMVDNYDSDVRVRMLVDEREMWLVPMVNPDGHSYSIERMDNLNNASNNDGWRKNLRDNDGDGEIDDSGSEGGGDGVDLNRNYRYLWFDRRSCSLDPESLLYRGPYDNKDDDGDWKGWDGENWNDDLNRNGIPDIDYDGPDTDGDDDGEAIYDPEPHVNEDYVDGIDNDEDGFIDEDPAGGLTEPETLALATLALDPDHDFRALFTYHAYGEYYLVNRGVESEGRPPEIDQMRELGRAFTDINGYALNDQSTYGTTGMTEDWFYYMFGTFGYTIEVGNQFIPPEEEIEGIEQENLEQNLILAEFAPYTDDLVFLDGFEDDGTRERWIHGSQNDPWEYRNDPPPGQGGSLGISGNYYLSADGLMNKTSATFQLRDPIDLEDIDHPVLTFWHTYGFGEESGGFIEVHTDGGPWMPVHPMEGYPGSFGNTTEYSRDSGRYSGWHAYRGSRSEWVQEVIDLGQYAGKSIRIRFHILTGPDGGGSGWKIDNTAILDSAGLPNECSISPTVALIDNSIEFTALRIDGYEDIANASYERIVWWSSIDGEIFNGSDALIELNGLSIGYHVITFRIQREDDSWSSPVFRALLVHTRPEITSTTIDPDPAFQTDIVTLSGEAIDDEGILLYLWESDLDGELHRGSEGAAMVANLSFGIHIFQLRVMDVCSIWSENVTVTLVVHERPIGKIISIMPDPVVEGELVRFIGEGTDDGQIKRYAWSSSIDGEFLNTTSLDENFSGLSVGNHSIRFSVMDENGAWSEAVALNLTVHRRPVAVIDPGIPIVVLNTQKIMLKGWGIDESGIDRYSWESDLEGVLYNGTDGTEVRIEHLGAGVHTITFRVRDEWGIWSEGANHTLLVHSRPVIENMTIGSDWNYAEQPVGFSGAGADDGVITLYRWNSSINGEMYLGKDPDFFLEGGLTAGVHRITFSVMDDHGVWSAEAAEMLIVYEPPKATINSIQPSISLQGNMVQFNAVDHVGLIRYVWTSSTDGEFLNGNLPQAGYSGLSNGTHTIRLHVIDGNGMWNDSSEVTLHVNGRPACTILPPSPDPPIEGVAVTFSALAIDDGSIESYTWISSKDGVLYEGAEDSFTHSGLSRGRHSITLRIRDDLGVWSLPVSEDIEVVEYQPPNQLPEVTITSPEHNGTLIGLVTGTAIDTDGSVVSVEVAVNRGAWIRVLGTETWQIGRGNGDGKIGFPERGWYTISARAFDGEDHSEVVSIRVFVRSGDDDGKNVIENEESGPGFLEGERGLVVLVGILCGLIGCLFLPWERLVKK
jgi:hypothetical protein